MCKKGDCWKHEAHKRGAHHCLQTMGSMKRRALESRCPKICTNRSEGSAVMLMELISSGYTCCSLGGNAWRFLEPLARPELSAVLCFPGL